MHIPLFEPTLETWRLASASASWSNWNDIDLQFSCALALCNEMFYELFERWVRGLGKMERKTMFALVLWSVYLEYWFLFHAGSRRGWERGKRVLTGSGCSSCYREWIDLSVFSYFVIVFILLSILIIIIIIVTFVIKYYYLSLLSPSSS